MNLEQQISVSKVSVRFRVKAETKFHQHLFIIGSFPSLGNWDVSRGHKLWTSSLTYPLWSSFDQIEVFPGEQLEFKCVIVTHNTHAVWEGISLNRRCRVPNQQIIIAFEFGRDNYEILKREGCDDHQFAEDGFGVKQIETIGFLSYEQNILTRNMFTWKNRRLCFKNTVEDNIDNFANSEIYQLKGLWLFQNNEVLASLNKHHKHSLNVCYDSREKGVDDFKNIERCKLVLCNSTEVMKGYDEHNTSLGFKTWIHKGSLIVINNYGLQIVTISNYDFGSLLSHKSELQGVQKQLSRLIRLIASSHNLFEVMFGKIKQEITRNCVIIYSNPDIINISQLQKNKLERLLQTFESYLLLTKTSTDDLYKYCPNLAKNNVISLSQFTITQNSQLNNLLCSQSNHLAQLKQRFIAEKVFNLVYDSPFCLVLEHNTPRLFQVQKQYFQRELSRFPKLKYNISNNTMKIQLIDLNDIVKKILEKKKANQVILLGTGSIFWDIDEDELQECQVHRIISIRQLWKKLKL